MWSCDGVHEDATFMIDEVSKRMHLMRPTLTSHWSTSP